MDDSPRDRQLLLPDSAAVIRRLHCPIRADSRLFDQQAQYQRLDESMAALTDANRYRIRFRPQCQAAFLAGLRDVLHFQHQGWGVLRELTGEQSHCWDDSKTENCQPMTWHRQKHHPAWLHRQKSLPTVAKLLLRPS